MIYALDTSTVVGLIRAKSPLIRQRYAGALGQVDAVLISSIVMFELSTGVVKGHRSDEQRRRLVDFLRGPVQIEMFDSEAAQHAAELRVHLERAGRPIGPYDLLIAAHALSVDATLVTSNVREFSRVPGLIVEDWSI